MSGTGNNPLIGKSEPGIKTGSFNARERTKRKKRTRRQFRVKKKTDTENRKWSHVPEVVTVSTARDGKSCFRRKTVHWRVTL